MNSDTSRDTHRLEQAHDKTSTNQTSKRTIGNLQSHRRKQDGRKRDVCVLGMNWEIFNVAIEERNVDQNKQRNHGEDG